MKILAENKRAFFDYQILEKYEAGISLSGQEVKSLRERGVNLSGTYVLIKNEEAFWVGAKIPPWQPTNCPPGYRQIRERKLLLKKNEIKKLIGKAKQKGLTLIPLRLYTKGRWIKLEFGIGKKRKKAEKKEILKEREIKREIQKELKEIGA